MEVKSRLRAALEAYNENPTSLSKRFGVNQKTLNNQINSDTAMSLSTILLISEALPDVSLEWLLRGRGEMELKSKAEMVFIGNTADNGSRQTFGNTTTTNNYSGCVDEEKDTKNYVHELLAAKDAIIAEKEKRIMEKDEMITLLKNQK